MKTLLDCDAVFEALTSGCHVDREAEAVQEHLGCCLECQQLSEAMEPAVDVFASEQLAVVRNRASARSLASKVLARMDGERSSTRMRGHNLVRPRQSSWHSAACSGQPARGQNRLNWRHYRGSLRLSLGQPSQPNTDCCIWLRCNSPVFA